MNRRLLTRIFLMSALCLAVVAGSVFFMGRESVSADTKVEINTTNFPDEQFRNYVLTHFDYKVPFAELDEEELSNAEEIAVYNDDEFNRKELKSLKGMELLPNLRSIYVNDCAIGSIDLSSNPKIETISIQNNKLNSINVGSLPLLKSLYICKNNIKTLDLSANPLLYGLDISETQISSINLSGLSELKEFSCGKCTNLNTIDVSNNHKLTHLSCSECGLSSIKMGSHPDLQQLYAGQNKLTTLDVSSYTKLGYFYCSDNKISSLNLKNCPDLKYFDCWNNNLTELDLSNCQNLISVNCSVNKITSINLKNCAELTEVDCSENQLKQINLKDSGKLEKLTCGYNQLTSITLPNDDNLRDLNCIHNKLTKLNISPCKGLIDVYKKGDRIDYTDTILFDYYDGTYGYRLEFDSNVKIITDANVEPTDTPTPTPTPVVDITDDTATATVAVGKKIKLDASVLGFKPYNWSSSNTSIATVDSNGYVTGKKAGTVTITVTKGAKKLICTVTVTGVASPTSAVKPTGAAKPTGSVSPTKAPANDKNTFTADPVFIVCGSSKTSNPPSILGSGSFKWTSSNTKIATVDKTGKITGIMAGSVTITVTCNNKKMLIPVTILYKDVTNTKDFWYAPTNYLTANGVVKGYDKQTKFKPANKCTRAQMVTFIWRLQGEPDPKSKTCKFKDVKQKDYFYKACIWGNENHIVEGYKDGTFGPQIVCARKHAVTFLWRLAGKPEPSTKTNKFSDVKTKDYFYKATLWASEQNILAGYKDGTFKPNGDCLRRQMVTFLYKYDKFINGKG